MADRCKGCNRKLIWGTTEDGKVIPLDAISPVYMVLGMEEQGLDHPIIRVKRETTAYVSHYATCPEASAFSASHAIKNVMVLLALMLAPSLVRADGVQVWAQQLPPAIVSATTASVTSLAVTTTPVIAMSDNAARLGLIIYNGPISVLYVSYGTTVNLDSMVVAAVPASGTWVMPNPIYKGTVSVMRASSVGRAVFTELK